MSRDMNVSQPWFELCQEHILTEPMCLNAIVSMISGLEIIILEDPRGRCLEVTRSTTSNAHKMYDNCIVKKTSITSPKLNAAPAKLIMPRGCEE